MSSHIKLGTTAATLREYMLVDYRQYLRSNANQLAAKIGTGAGDYSDLQSWTAFAMDNWQAGVGKKDVDAGGFLYADSETRWPNRLQLPMALVPATAADPDNYPLNTGYCPGIIKPESSVQVGSVVTLRKLAKRIEGNGTKLIGVHIYLANDDNVAATNPITTTINIGLWSDSASLPGSSITTKVEYINNTWGYGAHYVEFDNTLTDGTFYWIVVEPSTAGEVMNLPVDTSSPDPTADGMAWYNGATWASYSSGRMLIEPVMGMPPATEQINKLCYFPASGFMYAAAGETLYKQETDADKWEAVTSAFAANITDLHTDGDTLYIGIGDSTNYKTMDGAETITTASVPARIFTRWNGYLWRAVNNDVHYTSDGVTWSAAVEVCPDGFSVNGLSGQGDYMFVSCDDGLYYIGFGDSVFTVTPWGQLDPSENFGEGMLNWQGALYIPLNAGIYRYDASSMLPVGPDLGEGLPLNRSGVIGAIATQNNWLYCLVRATAGASTVWAYNGQGWHYVTEAPTNDELYFTSIHYRRTNQKIYLGTNKGVIFTVVATDNPNAIDLDTLAYTTPYGTIETDWIYGGLRDVRKDWESVMIMGDGIDSLHPVRVYWLDEQSEAWEYLGEVTASGQELRWSDYTTRPNSKQLCIGLGLYAKETVNYQGTPIIRGVRVKYHNMVTDTWRWNLPIQVSDDQMTSTTLNTYTAAQMRAHLDALTRQVPPIIYEDPFGEQHECKVLDCTVQMDKMEYVNGATRYSAVYRLTIEQVAYSAST
jgi:hypothetical protein